MDSTVGRLARRTAVTAPLTVGLLLVTAVPAGAHVEVSAEGAQAGTGPVTVSFSAESESATVGIVGMKTQLPRGIAPADVSLASGPAGWVLTPTADGFELAGPGIGAGVDAKYSVTIAQLPADTTELVFPTLQRYADGREDAWIEPVTDALPNPDSPAPVLTVEPPPPGVTTTTAPTTAPTTDSAETPAPTEAARPTTDEESNTWTIAIVTGLLAAAASGAGVWVWRARRRA